MLYYLFAINRHVKPQLPFNIDDFKYEKIDKNLYYILQIDNENIKILDEQNNELSSGNLVKTTENNYKITYYLSIGKLIFAGGIVNIKDNKCELIIHGSGLPYIGAYKGTLRKLLKKEEVQKN